MSLSELLAADSPSVEAIGEYLDTRSLKEQVGAVRSLSIKQVHRCWAIFEPHATIDLEYLVPAARGAGQPVHHLGINTLPVSRHFEKRFVRSPENPEQLWGYNHQALAWLTGPGSFVVHERGTEGHDALFIDYRTVPSGEIEGWPRAKSNERGIARLVYGGMQDFMRRVSSRVSVGRAFVRGKDLGASFMLVRAD